ncbi:N-acetylglucosamine-1-phosphotransferase subunit gamma [Lamellibrachia satsuma]|nr:N-acetylglucosamine-1-phosphotransferase subunit gamma [Lamellibrachia satsuma]
MKLSAVKIPFAKVLCVISSGLIFCRVSGTQLPIKIVDEPTHLGYGVAGGSYQSHTETLKMRVKPSPFSGPPHLKELYGRCFSKTDDSYKYEFCPFFNVTQHEQSLRWNPYSGVLGVWQEWEIQNNTFIAMVLREGDTCGDRFRTIRVLMECGNMSEVTDVTEPHTCDYQLVFHTPLVCHPHALLVYPSLNNSLQEEWDLIEGRLLNDELTKQGYDKSIRRLFERAGLYMSATQKEAQKKKTVIKEEHDDELETGDFHSLDKCSKAYKTLKNKVEGLKTLLAIHQITINDTGDADSDHQLSESLTGDTLTSSTTRPTDNSARDNSAQFESSVPILRQLGPSVETARPNDKLLGSDFETTRPKCRDSSAQ